MSAVVQQILGEAAKDHPLSDDEIVRSVLAGEKALYEVLMRRHNRKLYRAVRSILKDEDEVEGVMQQAYVSAYFKLDSFRGASSFSTWLIRIAIHEAFARLRRSRRFVENDAQDLMTRFPSKDRDPEELASDRELGRMLEQAIDGLPQMYRTVFLMREIEGLGTIETAECLGLSPENVKVRRHRARSRLRYALYDRVGTEVEAAFPFHAPRCDRVAAAVLDAIDPGRAPNLGRVGAG
jgi:RNA polymerase sigma-70 factor, ECF subfamily